MTVPAITIADLSEAHVILSRTRYATPWCEEPLLRLYAQRFESSSDIDTLFPSYTGASTVTTGSNGLRFQASVAATASYVCEYRPKTSQFCVIGDLEYLSVGGALSAFYVCAAITATSTSNTFTDFVYAVINRTEAAPNGVLSLGYSKNGVFHEVSAAALAEPLAVPDPARAHDEPGQHQPHDQGSQRPLAADAQLRSGDRRLGLAC
jgi:hypothetical protein